MSRQILVAICIGVAVAMFLGLRMTFLAFFPTEESAPVLGADNSVVAIAGGSVMFARPGTISRDVIDWFNNKSAGPTQFDIGVQPFVANSDLPAPEAKVRLDRFAVELAGNPDVNATIMVCGSANNGADRQLAAARAYRLKEELVADQIDADRISTAPCQAKAAPGGIAAASGQSGQTVRIALSRGG